MRLLSFLVLGIGLALAGSGVYYAKQLAEPKINNIENDVSIIVAKRTLVMNERIMPGDLVFLNYPRHLAPQGAFQAVHDLLGGRNDFRFVRHTIHAGEPVVAVKLFGLREEPGFGLGHDWRAMAIAVDARDAIAGFVGPGDHVDLFLVRDIEGTMTSTPLLRGVEVLAVDQNANRESHGPRLGNTLTLRLRDVDAQRVDIARRLGDLSITLRGKNAIEPSLPKMNDGSLDETDLPGITSDEAPFVWKSDGEGNRIKVPLR